jgi:hypothetical protein
MLGSGVSKRREIVVAALGELSRFGREKKNTQEIPNSSNLGFPASPLRCQVRGFDVFVFFFDVNIAKSLLLVFTRPCLSYYFLRQRLRVSFMYSIQLW